MTRPAHIIADETGREYDLTALETPPVLLPGAVCEALEKWPHGCQSLMDDGWIYSHPSRYRVCVQRAKPAPVEVRVKCWRGVTAGTETGTCIKRADGSIDWQSWEPQP